MTQLPRYVCPARGKWDPLMGARRNSAVSRGREGGRKATAFSLPESGTVKGPGCLVRPTHSGEAEGNERPQAPVCPPGGSQAALLVPGAKVRGVSYGEPCSGQQFRLQQATLILLYAGPIPRGHRTTAFTLRTFPQRKGRRATGRVVRLDSTAQSGTAWVMARWEVCCQLSQCVPNSSLSEWGPWTAAQPSHVGEAALTTPRSQTESLSLKELCTERISTQVCLSPNAIFPLLNLITF